MDDSTTKGEATEDVVTHVRKAFMIFEMEAFLEPLIDLTKKEAFWNSLVADATEGLHSVLCSASLPFQLICESVQQRRFERILIAARIRALPHPSEGEKPVDIDQEKRTLHRARETMDEFVASEEGSNYLRDTTVEELYRTLQSANLRIAAMELLIQTLVSTWAVFETFASSFVIAWINADPRRAKSLFGSPDLRTFFGKSVVDIDVIDDHDFDLTRSMGSIIFRGKRLDNLGVLRNAMEALFSDSDVRAALGDDLWMLNQRRHLYVHKRGLVDQEYLDRTKDNVPLGHRLVILSGDVERYLLAVRTAIVAISSAASNI